VMARGAVVPVAGHRGPGPQLAAQLRKAAISNSLSPIMMARRRAPKATPARASEPTTTSLSDPPTNHRPSRGSFPYPNVFSSIRS
jgi:hypothetical protein